MSQDGKDKALAMRDRLNKLAEDVMVGEPDMEDHVVACCLAVAVEELEKWIYDNDWTPSVRPYIDDRDFKVPFPDGSKDDPSQSGAPWDRKKVSIFDRCPTAKKLKDQGRLNPTDITEDALDSLKVTPFEDWDVVLRVRFRDGDKTDMVKAIRLKTGASIKRIMDFVDTLIVLMPRVWGIDNKPGDKCPNPQCGGTNIKKASANMRRAHECKDCGTLWGKEVW